MSEHMSLRENMQEGEIIFKRLNMMAESEEYENGPWSKIVNAIIDYHEDESKPEETDADVKRLMSLKGGEQE